MLTLATFLIAQALQVFVSVDAGGEAKPISPYIYGMNNALSSWTGQANSVEFVRLRDAGVRLFRDNGGNNATKYNWRLKLSSHPDWYNNVYSNDWDHRAELLSENFPNAKGLFAFQLLGKAAATTNQNFNDWGYNQSQWWEGVRNNWAGGGGPTRGEGNPDLYLMDWPADSTVGILEHWFGERGLRLEPSQFQYWNMDNEPEIWNGTHDDVMPTQLPAEEFMQKYFAVAKKARAAYPEIKLLGPSPANEWQWYNWTNGIRYDGRHHSWLEYFIRRIGEEQQASGVRLLDVLDVHFYPYETNPRDVVQLHRVWFDTSYDYPGANGVKAISGGWNQSLTKEYLFERCRQWLDQYL
ncbi:MAG TPA: glycoside hydrolase family 44 protein, partial [Rhodothermales bacterium]